MSVGNQGSADSVSQSLTNFALGMRQVMQSIANLNTFVNGQGTGQATLEALGYSSEDATTALADLAYLNTVAGVYFGTATQASEFNFNNQLAPLWGGQ
jgi:hypothetical protein